VQRLPGGCRPAGAVGVVSFSPTIRFVTVLRLYALVAALLVCAWVFASSAFAASTSTVDLGQAAGYAIISGASVANTGSSTVRGDIGAPTTPTGLSSSVLDGNMQVGSADATAYNDFLTAYADVQTRTGGTALPTLAGATLTPGLYTSGAAAGLAASTAVTLDAGGNPTAVFVIQVDGALALGASAQVKLIGGAQASNVFWAVNGAFSLGANGQFAGTVLASTTGDVGAGSLVNGRVLAETAVTTNSAEFYSAPPTMTLTGGAMEDLSDSSPVLSGTSNVGPSGVVTVTVAGQTLTATPAVDGSWSVAPTILANGTYPVLASTVDGAGNVGSATQQLTIDTVPPLITLNGAPTVLTSNPSPSISGVTDAAPGTLVTVDVEAQTLSAVVNGTTITESVGAQTLTAVVQSNGTWNVSPGVPMGEGAHTVTASVTDPAGNTSTATEQLTVDDIAATTPAPSTPTSPTSTPTLPVSTPTPPISTPTSTRAPQTPQRVSVSSHILTARRPVKVSFTLAKAGTVQLTLVEMVHGKAKAIGTVTVKDPKAGKGSYKLTERFAGHKLDKGSYRLNLQTTSGKLRSKTVTQKVSVRS
jgi:ice-binding like protein/Big-like domain-containing protein